MATIYHNVCPADCFASCRMKTVVESGKIIEVHGDPADPYTQGSLCAKGYSYCERVYGPERVLYPMKQVGKGTGNWQRISWEQAIGEIAHKFLAIKEQEHNLLPVCFDKYLGSTGLLGQSVQSFFAGIGPITWMVGSPCDTAGIDALMLHYGACRKPHPADMANAKAIFIWGGNPAWTAPHQMRYIYEAQSRGAKVVVIDPVFSATAARSDVYIQIKPATDGFLALGMAKALLDDQLIDYEFINQYTYGWEQFKTYLSHIHLGQMADLCGVSEEEIVRLANCYAENKPAAIWLGIGGQRNQAGGQNFRAIDALAAMTGNIGLSGGNVHYVSQEGWTGLQDMNGSRPEQGASLHRMIGKGRFKELQSLQPSIRLMWIAGRNPVSQDPDTTQVQEFLRSVETVVVADQILTPTAQLADYFLPVATFFEYEDIVISNWHYGIAVNQQAIEPLGESRSDFDIMKSLAQKLNNLSPGFTDYPINIKPSDWLDREMRNWVYPMLGIDHYSELVGQYRQLDIPDVPWKDRSFLTLSGKYEFYSQLAISYNLNPLPVPSHQASISASYPYQLISIRSFSALNSQFRMLPRLRQLQEDRQVFLNPATANKKGIEEGNEVSVYNWLGGIRLKAALTRSVPPDILVAYVGVNSTFGIELNHLVTFEETDLGRINSKAQGISFQNCYVDICKV